MPLVDIPLDVSGKTTLSASGGGRVRLSPATAMQTWHVSSAAVRVSSNTNEPTAILSLNGMSQLASTYTGSNDSTDLDITVRGGYVECVWTGGDAGATASLFLQGSVHVGG